MSRRNQRKKKRNQLQDFKTRVICPECSSEKITMLNKTRNIFICKSCGHKFIYDAGVYDILQSNTIEQVEIQEEKTIVATGRKDPLDDWFDNLRL